MLEIWKRLQLHLELALPLSIAIFAAALGVNDLLSGNYGADEIKLSNLRNNGLQWYQSKGIKGTIVEGQMDLVKVLIKSGSIAPDKRGYMTNLLQQLQSKVNRYDSEKREILLGSRQLPAAQWTQEVDGELGKLVGAKEYEQQIDRLAGAGDYFDIASMLFQLCLVTGAVGIVVAHASMKWAFFQMTVCIGLTGVAISVHGLTLALG